MHELPLKAQAAVVTGKVPLRASDPEFNDEAALVGVELRRRSLSSLCQRVSVLPTNRWPRPEKGPGKAVKGGGWHIAEVSIKGALGLRGSSTVC